MLGRKPEDGPTAHSLRTRLGAWWRGEPLAETPVGEATAEEAVPAHAAAAGPTTAEDAAAAPPTEPGPAGKNTERGASWSHARMAVSESVWGEGCASPGDPDDILGLIRQFGLNERMTMLDIGAGLGAITRHIAKDTGAWCTGLELDAELARGGQERSTQAGLGKRAEIRPFVAPDLGVRDASFDCVLCREVLYRTEDKEGLIAAIDAALKPGGEMLFTDLARAEGAERSPCVQAWAATLAQEPRFWGMDDLGRALAARNLEVRVHEDISEWYHRLVVNAWCSFADTLADNARGCDSLTVLDEVRRWSLFVAAIESGDLRVYRVFARKTGGDDVDSGPAAP